MGCYEDKETDRDLNGYSYENETMTIEMCINICMKESVCVLFYIIISF